jgi:hypothetical protein
MDPAQPGHRSSSTAPDAIRRSEGRIRAPSAGPKVEFGPRPPVRRSNLGPVRRSEGRIWDPSAGPTNLHVTRADSDCFFFFFGILTSSARKRVASQGDVYL